MVSYDSDYEFSNIGFILQKELPVILEGGIRAPAIELVGKSRLGVQSAWITYTSISLCLSALDFKQDIEDIYLAGVLVEVQAARKLVVMHSFIVAA